MLRNQEPPRKFQDQSKRDDRPGSLSLMAMEDRTNFNCKNLNDFS